MLLIAGVLLLYVAILPGVLNRLVGLPFPAKLLVSAVFLIPLGFAMGMPFPTGLRALGNKTAIEFPALPDDQAGENPVITNLVEWAWAMNAASSVLGSVVAIIIAIQFGLNVTLACGAAAYLLALGLVYNACNPAPKWREWFAVVCYYSGILSLIRLCHSRINICSGECVPSQKQLKWSELKVGLTVLAACVTLGILIFLMSGTGGCSPAKSI